MLTGPGMAANPLIEEEALQAALSRLLEEVQPRLNMVAMVRCVHAVQDSCVMHCGAPPEGFESCNE